MIRADSKITTSPFFALGALIVRNSISYSMRSRVAQRIQSDLMIPQHGAYGFEQDVA